MIKNIIKKAIKLKGVLERNKPKWVKSTRLYQNLKRFNLDNYNDLSDKAKNRITNEIEYLFDHSPTTYKELRESRKQMIDDFNSALEELNQEPIINTYNVDSLKNFLDEYDAKISDKKYFDSRIVIKLYGSYLKSPKKVNFNEYFNRWVESTSKNKK